MDGYVAKLNAACIHQDLESEKIQEALERIREDEIRRIEKIAEYEKTIKKHQQELDNPPEIEAEEPLVEKQASSPCLEHGRKAVI